MSGTRTETTITVILPLPSQILGPNGRAHWGERAQAVTEAKIIAWAKFKEQMGPGVRYEWSDPVRVKLHWVYRHGRPPDVDNAISRVKHFLDSAELAGVIQDDRQVIGYDVTFEHGAESRLEMTLEVAA